MRIPKIGAVAPEIILPDQDNKIQKLSDYKGSWVLLYFYPKDDTPGCAKQACGIRDIFPNFSSEGGSASGGKKFKIVVLGVSINSPASHKKFIEKYDLPFTLLADEEKTIVKKYGVWGKKKFMGREYDGTFRTSFLINPSGKIVKIYEQVKPEVHAQEVISDIRNLIE